MVYHYAPSSGLRSHVDFDDNQAIAAFRGSEDLFCGLRVLVLLLDPFGQFEVEQVVDLEQNNQTEHQQ